MYRTHAKLTLMGRSIAVQLDDCQPSLPTTLNDPHMTVLFRKDGYTEQELQMIQTYRDTHFPETMTFRLGSYTHGYHNSDGIYGALRRFCVLVRAVFETWHEQPRPPHVKLR